jgi:hypothetical protein
MSQSRCAGCGIRPPADASFCPRCGTELAVSETLEIRAPTIHRVERRRLGLGAVPLLGGLSCAASLVAIVLFAIGAWAAGISLIAVAVALGALFLNAARHEPDSETARAALKAADRTTSRASLAAVALRACSRAALELVRLRGREQRLHSQLQGRLKPLGEAVHSDDHERASELKAQADELKSALEQTKREAAAVKQAAREQIDRERIVSQPTRSLPLQ